MTEDLLREIVHQFDEDWTAGRSAAFEIIDEGDAADLLFSPANGFGTQADCAELGVSLRELAENLSFATTGSALAFDVIVQPANAREKKLLVSDMDSTMITVECIDELADYAGIKPEIAAITERAMAGELNFEAALEARVALLKGLPVATLDQCYEERVRFTPGAATLVATMRGRGATTVLVSGGFAPFSTKVGAALGFDRVVANRLGVRDGRLDGTVARPIVGAEAKRAVLLETMTSAGLTRAEALAVGDGANDVPMIEAAGMGVAFRAKPKVEAAAGASIRHGDLTALLWAQGIPRAEWVTP